MTNMHATDVLTKDTELLEQLEQLFDDENLAIGHLVDMFGPGRDGEALALIWYDVGVPAIIVPLREHEHDRERTVRHLVNAWNASKDETRKLRKDVLDNEMRAADLAGRN